MHANSITSITILISKKERTGAERRNCSCGRTAQTADGWEYDGFLTVVVTD